MLGAHLDSEPNGTGATDNAAGCAVALEAMRLLATLHLPLRRTVRIALWTGEEQGLLGSEAYVGAHFGSEVTHALTADQARVSAYFNLDNGSGAIRGVYAEGNLRAMPIFRSWLKPFHDWGAQTVTPVFTEGTDHERFDAVGIPGFQFIQDGLDYDVVAHTNMDVFDRLDAEALARNAVIMASFVLHAANREAMLPRKPLWEH